MPRVELDGLITDFERAICYFTLPRLIYRINPWALFIYFVCVIITLTLLFLGIITGIPSLTYTGSISFVVVTIVGIIMFTGRALLNELRWRKCLAEAHGIQNTAEADLPDPFEDHTLLLVSSDTRGSLLYPIMNREGEVKYFVEEKEPEKYWIVKDHQENPVCQIQARASLFSFTLSMNKPRVIYVQSQDKCISVIKPKVSFYGDSYILYTKEPSPQQYWVLQSGIFFHGELVGRIYNLRRYTYLDVREDHFSLGMLALLLTSR